MIEKRAKTIELPRSIDRLTFAFVQHCIIEVDGGAIAIRTDHGNVNIPAASMSCLIIGPGSSMTHAAAKLLSDAGTVAVWSGEDETRLYSVSRSLTSNSKLAMGQADVVSHLDKRLACARKMYAERFPGDDFSTTSIGKMRSKEGARMRELYKAQSERTGVDWGSRHYKIGDITDSDIVNRCITVGTHVIYDVELGIINGLGLSPALGIIHQGNSLAFVYDMTDLFKSDIVIPYAFDIAMNQISAEDADVEIRKRVREGMTKKELLKRSVNYCLDYFSPDEKDKDVLFVDDVIGLWNTNGEILEGSVNRG